MSGYRDLRHYLEVLDRDGGLKRVAAPVSSALEISEIVDRVVKRGGPALLFENVDGGRVPVLINAFGTEARVRQALRIESVDELFEEFVALAKLEIPTNFLERLKFLPTALPALRDAGKNLFPRMVDAGLCQQVVAPDETLDSIPILTCWPKDAGPYITLPLVITKDPETGNRNVGMYRLQKLSPRRLAMHWHRHKGGAAHFARYRARGEKMPVAIAIGPDPATTFAAAFPAPDGVDEFSLAGVLRKRPVRLVPCKTIPLEVPDNAQYVLEGWVDPAAPEVVEGPFGDHTGFYSLEDPYPAFELSCITRAAEPIYHTIVVGRPPTEDCFMGSLVERIMLPLVRLQLPEVTDLHAPHAGVFHNLLLVSIKKRYPGHARKVMHALWGLGQAMFTKLVLVFDDGVDLRDYPAVTWRALANVDPGRDMESVKGPLDVLEHASAEACFGTKLGFDCTTKLPEEGHRRRWPAEIVMSPEIRARVDARWKELFGDGP